LAAALRPRGHNKCAALWAAAAAAGTAGAEAARMMSRRSRGRNSTHDVLNYSNPGKESWSGHGAFRGARRRRRGSRLRRPLTRRGAAYKYWRTLGRRKMDRCGNLRALWGGLIDAGGANCGGVNPGFFETANLRVQLGPSSCDCPTLRPLKQPFLRKRARQSSVLDALCALHAPCVLWPVANGRVERQVSNGLDGRLCKSFPDKVGPEVTFITPSDRISIIRTIVRHHAKRTG